MKTTVKDFILENLTDRNFEKLVNTLITEKVRYYTNSDEELVDITSNYLNSQSPIYLENDTFEIVNEIKKVKVISAVSLDLELEVDFPQATLNVPSNHINNNESEYFSLREIKTALLFDEHTEGKDILGEINIENYQECLQKEKPQITFSLLTFIHEVLSYSDESKFETYYKEFSKEQTYLKIINEQKYMDGYGFLFYLDSKSRHVSQETKAAYRKRSEENVDNEGRHNLPRDAWEFPVNEPEFLEYTEVIESLEMDYERTLAPFTFYLNKELSIPKFSDEILYDLLEQLIHVLTFQGFTEDEQITNIEYSKKVYEKNQS